MANNRSVSLRMYTTCAMLLALILVLTVTPIGFITISGDLAATIIHLPLLVGLMTEGLWAGLFLGASFGAISFIRTFTNPSLLSPYLMNPLVSIMPRVLIPLVAWAVYCLVMRLMGRSKTAAPTAMAIAAAVGSAVNTLGVLGMMYITAASAMGNLTVMAEVGVRAYLTGIALTHGIPEAVIAALVVPAVTIAVQKAQHRSPLEPIFFPTRRTRS